MSNVINLNDRRPNKMRVLDHNDILNRLKAVKIFKAEMKDAGTIKDQDDRVNALNIAYDKFCGNKSYKGS